jgi:hypothetical protein
VLHASVPGIRSHLGGTTVDSKLRASRTVLISLAIVLVVTAVGVAYAAVPGSDGTVQACYVTANGQLRVIDAEAGESCRPNETAIALATPTSVGCPAGTTMFVGVCIEDQPRTAASQRDATRDCADEQRRLPSGGELQAFREFDGVTLAGGGEWTDDLGDVTYASSFVYLVVTETGNGIAEAFDAHAYRCVAGPTLG